MKMRSQWRRVGPNPMTGVIRRKKCGHTRRAEDHVKTEDGVMPLQAQVASPRYQKLSRDTETTLP